MQRPETRDRFGAIGTEPAGGTPADLAAEIRAEVARMGKAIREAGIAERWVALMGR